jgi:hypothetical protein
MYFKTVPLALCTRFLTFSMSPYRGRKFTTQLKKDATSEFLNFALLRWLNRFIPEKPWQGGPPVIMSTSPPFGKGCLCHSRSLPFSSQFIISEIAFTLPL